MRDCLRASFVFPLNWFFVAIAFVISLRRRHFDIWRVKSYMQFLCCLTTKNPEDTAKTNTKPNEINHRQCTCDIVKILPESKVHSSPHEHEEIKCDMKFENIHIKIQIIREMHVL